MLSTIPEFMFLKNSQFGNTLTALAELLSIFIIRVSGFQESMTTDCIYETNKTHLSLRSNYTFCP